MAPLTAAEIIEHPAFKDAVWDLPPTKKGKVEVAKDRGGPFELAYEIHGHGPLKLVWIMGLGSFKSAWQRQTKDFGHDRASQYSILIFDNRGMGESDKPLIRYSTSEMAKDTIELLDHLGWTAQRQLHIVGISMGGMISQEMGLLVPERIGSLSLISTAARIVNTIGFLENIRNRANMFIPRSLDTQLATVSRQLFSASFLAAPDYDASPTAGFPTNTERWAAQEITKRQSGNFTRRGFMLQLIASGWHFKSDEQLRELGDKVGRERILVAHGMEDEMITPPHGEVLARALGWTGQMGESEPKRLIAEDVGHVLPMERRKEFFELIEGMVEKGERLNA